MLHTMSLSSLPIDRRLLFAGAAFLLAGLLGVFLLGWLTPAQEPARGLPAELVKNTVTACHVLGMALCTAACLPRTLLAALAASFSWAALHVLKELSEHPVLSAWCHVSLPRCQPTKAADSARTVTAGSPPGSE